VIEAVAAAVKAAVAEANKKAEESTAGLVAKRDQLLEEVVGYKDKLKGYNPERVAELEKLEKEIKAKKQQKSIDDNDLPTVVADYETRLADTVTAKDKEILTAKEDLAKVKSSYIKTNTKNAVLAALAAAKVLPDVMLNNVMPLVDTIVKEDGTFETFVKDAEGKQRFNPTDNTPVTVEGLLAEMSLLPAFAPNFPKSSGGGAQQRNDFSGPDATKLSELTTFDKKQAYIEKFGEEQFEKLVAAG
jgi:hypothetical protein